MLGLGAAGVYTGALSDKDRGRIRTVAIVSAIGRTFAFEHVRNGVFEWAGPPDAHYLEISDWGLDDTVTREIAAKLSQHFTVKKVVFQPADFGTWDSSTLKQRVFGLNGDPDIDAYILVLRDWRHDEIGNSVHDVNGLGLYRRDMAEGPPREGLFAAYRIVAIDANTGDIFASRPALTPDGALPWMQTPPTLWPRTQNDLTDAQKAALQTGVTRLIDETLLRTLTEMNLAH